MQARLAQCFEGCFAKMVARAQVARAYPLAFLLRFFLLLPLPLTNISTRTKTTPTTTRSKKEIANMVSAPTDVVSERLC